MRKLLVVILALSILFSMASFVGVYANDEVIFSESFENGKDNWSFNGSRSNDTNAFLTKEQAQVKTM